MRLRRFGRGLALGLVLVLGATGSLPGTTGAWAQRTDYVPPELEGIEIQDRSGEFLDPDLEFVDENGQAVRLGDYFEPGRPLIVQLVYFECPMLCNLVINGFVDGARDLAWSPGREYTVLSVSFDPKDGPELAKLKQANYGKALGKDGVEEGWHFLTGDSESVKALSASLGFPYRYMEKTGEFSHGAGIFVVTPEGKISRTLYGLSFPSNTLRFSLMEASEGRLGSPLDKVVLFCFRYNADQHRYTLVAVNAMKLGGAATALGLAAFLGVLWSRERRRTRSAGQGKT